MSIERIALVTDGCLDKQDGVQRYVAVLGQWLATEGLEVHYLTSGSVSGEMHGGLVHSLAYEGRLRGNGNVFSAAVFPRRSEVLTQVRDGYFDIVHTQLPQGPFVGGRVLRAAHERTATVGTYHLLPYSRSQDRLLRVSDRLSRRSLNRLDALVAPSKVVAKYAKSVLGTECKIIPVPVSISTDSEPVNVSLSTGSRGRVCFVGRLVPRKGCDDAIRALATIPARSRPFLTIVGEGPQRAASAELARREGVSDSVRFLGRRDDTEKERVLRESDLAVFPATSGESFGIVLVEAMLCRTPVVATRNPGYASTMADLPSQLVEPHSPMELGRKIVEMLELKTSDRDFIIRRQLEVARKSDAQVVGRALLDLYERLAHARS